MRINQFKANPLPTEGDHPEKVISFQNNGSPISGTGFSYMKEQEFKNTHLVFEGAPSEWAFQNGATHTLWVDCDHSTRPAIQTKTRLYVMVDEDGDGPVWEKWIVSRA